MFYTIHLNSFSALSVLVSGIEQCGHFLHNLFSLWPRTEGEEEEEEALVVAPVVLSESELLRLESILDENNIYTDKALHIKLNEAQILHNADHIVCIVLDVRIQHYS